MKKDELDKLVKEIGKESAKNIFNDLMKNDWKNEEIEDKQALEKIFGVNLKYGLFPGSGSSKRKSGISDSECFKSYLKSWGKTYFDFKNPSERKGHKIKAPYDSMIYFLLSRVYGIDGLSKEQMKKAHESAMQAENLIGLLLEEFIAKMICHQNNGWVWCRGSTMASVDFLFLKGEKSEFLQIKNKFNTENSSSDKIRDKKPVNIKVWHRLENEADPNGGAKADWDDLRKMVSEPLGTKESDFETLSEDEFQRFVDKAAECNKDLIYRGEKRS